MCFFCVVISSEPAYPLGFQGQLHEALHRSIFQGRDAQRPHLAVGFRDEHPSNRQRYVTLQVQTVLEQTLSVRVGVTYDSVDTGSSPAAILLAYFADGQELCGPRGSQQTLQGFHSLGVAFDLGHEDSMLQSQNGFLHGYIMEGSWEGNDTIWRTVLDLNQVLFYAEGKWDVHLERFAELPAGSIIYHIDRSDPVKVHRALGRKFCLSGGMPNALLAFGTPEQVRAHCRKLIETIGAEGGYIMDASAIMQNDATIENLKAMTEATLEYGIYRSPSSPGAVIPAEPAGGAAPGLPAWVTAPKVSPGICRMWEEKRRELPPISGDAGLVERVWNDVEGLAYLYIWHVLLSF